MKVTVSDVMRHVRTFFVSGSVCGEWGLEGGVLSPAAFSPGSWIAIEGPDAPAGVYQLDENGALPLEGCCAWQGRICQLAPPADFLRLCGEISVWADAHPDPSLQSERFGEYSRTQAVSGWQGAFADALRPYMHMYREVNC